MKRAIRFIVVAGCLFLMSIATAVAQDQYTEGGVTRVTLVQILPGHFNAFMEDLKTNIKPIWDAQKQAGLIEGYSIFLNTTKANPDDWDIGVESRTGAVAVVSRWLVVRLSLSPPQSGLT